MINDYDDNEGVDYDDDADFAFSNGEYDKED